MAIGDQRPSRQLIQAPAPRVSEDAFGAGVARGLGNMSQSLAELQGSKLQLAEAEKRTEEGYKQRQEKLQRSSASADLVRMRAETAREVEELRRTWPNPTAEGFTNAVNDLVAEKAEKFGGSLSPELQAEFEPRLADFQETFVTSSFETEIEAGDAAYSKAAEDITQTAVDEILLGSLTLGDATEEIDLFLDSSPLSQLATDELAQEIFSSLQTAAYSVEAQKTAQDPAADRGALPAPDPSSGIYATGMPPAAAGFLGVTGGAESGNDYNVMYSPEGRRTFDDFSEHPNSPARIKDGPHAGDVSTAAGRYQIIHSTWLRAKEALGLEDFSPANQDRAAWWIAQDAFERDSGGITLEQALSSGDRTQIEKVRRVLSGESGSGVVYEGLRKDKGMSPDKFFEAVVSGEATMPGAAVDPRYDGMSLTDKLAIFNDAVTTENDRKADLLQQQQARRSAAVNELVANLNLGRAGESDILAANEQFGFSAVELDKLNTAYENAYDGQVSAQKFSARLNSPGFTFDPTRAGDRDEANNYASRAFAERLDEQDEAAFNTQIAPFVQQTGFVPGVVQQKLTQFSKSADPEVADFGFRSMQTLLETDPDAFERTFGADGRAVVKGYVGSKLRGQTLQDFQAEVRARQMQPDYFKRVDDALRQAEKDNPRKFSPQSIADEVAGVGRFGSSADFGTLQQRTSLVREYRALVQNAMLYNEDVSEAHDTAVETLQSRFGESEIGEGESYFLRRPPEKVYPTVAGSHKWIEQQVRETVSIEEGQPFRLISDGQTEAEISAGAAPSYMIFTSENGNFVPHMTEGEDGRTFPTRMNFEQTGEMRDFEISRTLLRDEVHKLREEDEFIRQDALRRGPAPEQRERLKEIEKLIEEKQAEIEELEGKFR